MLPFCKSLWALLIVLGAALPVSTAALSFEIVKGGLTPKVPHSRFRRIRCCDRQLRRGEHSVFPLIQGLATAMGLLSAMVFLSIRALLLFPVSLFLCRPTGSGAVAAEELKSVRLVELVQEV